MELSWLATMTLKFPRESVRSRAVVIGMSKSKEYAHSVRVWPNEAQCVFGVLADKPKSRCSKCTRLR